MITTELFFINGKWTAPSGDGRIDVLNPSTGDVICWVPAGNAADVDAAVDAAKNAFQSWSTTNPKRRAEFLAALCDGLEARSDELTNLIMQELGMPEETTRAMQVGLGLAESRAHIELLSTFPFQETAGNSLLIHEPVGVVGAITPWNYPLTQMLRKVAPALAAGCTVVAKPSELAPLSAFVLAEVASSVGLPDGVLNVITGYGEEAGEPIVAHTDVDMVTLTGSTRAGRRVSEVGSRTIKRLALELGGKSPSVILDDADLETAVAGTLNWTYLNSGQTCSALTRMLVPRALLREAEDIAVALSKGHVVGPPTDASSTLGPLISEQQLEKVKGYIQAGVDEGARLILDGRGVSRDTSGYFIAPTIFTDVTPGMKIEQEEIFGPVLTILPYDDEAEAVEIANDTEYGLQAAVWSADDDRATEVARRIRAGQIEINGGDFNPIAPHGGFKQSGHGRENGLYGFTEFLEVKSLQLNT